MLIKIRDARISDVPEIVKIYVDAYRRIYEKSAKENYIKTLSYRKEAEYSTMFPFTAEKSQIIKVAIVKNEIIGYIAAGHNTGEPSGYDAEVHEMVVREEFRHRGIGRQLMRIVGKWFSDNGYSSVAACCWMDNKNTGFFSRLGGRIVYSKIKNTGGMGQDIVMFGWSMQEFMSVM